MATKKNSIELYFEWWLQELKEAGYILDWSRETYTFRMYSAFKFKKPKYFKTKKPIFEERNLLQKLTYTPDYVISWSEKADKIFFEVFNDNYTLYYDAKFIAQKLFDYHDKKEYIISYVDIKPPSKVAQYGNITSFVTFPIIQKMIMNTEGIYINKVVPIPMSGSGKSMALFNNTFTPKRYLFTDGGKQVRTFKWKIFTFKEYIAKREKEVEFVDKQIEKHFNNNQKELF